MIPILGIFWSFGMNNSDLLDLVQSVAQEEWGEKWMANLVRRYCEISQAQGDLAATVSRRRPQIERVFKSRSCSVATLLLLFSAVGLQIRVVKVKVVEEELFP